MHLQSTLNLIFTMKSGAVYKTEISQVIDSNRFFFIFFFSTIVYFVYLKKPHVEDVFNYFDLFFPQDVY